MMILIITGNYKNFKNIVQKIHNIILNKGKKEVKFQSSSNKTVVLCFKKFYSLYLFQTIYKISIKKKLLIFNMYIYNIL
jgi:hypothetical protein